MDIELNGRILVADDEKVNVDFFQIMLERLGFEVDVAYNGEEVIKKVGNFNPDIILLDLLMPKMNGIEATKIIKSNPKTKDIPIIILTAIDDIKEKVDLFEIGVEDYITKPFNFIEILARIRGILKNRRLKEATTSNERKINILEEYFKKSGKLIGSLEKILEKCDIAGISSLTQQGAVNSIESLFNSLIDIKDKLIELHKNVKDDIEIY